MAGYEFNYPEPEGEEAQTPLGAQRVEAAVGVTAMNLEELDEQLSTSISFLLRQGDDVGRIVTAGLSFRSKLQLLECLFRQDRPTSTNLEDLRDLASALGQIEEKRNQIVHSRWQPHELESRLVTRLRYTARAKQGLQRQEEHLSCGQIEAVGLHCAYLAHCLDTLMFTEFGTDYGLE